MTLLSPIYLLVGMVYNEVLRGENPPCLSSLVLDCISVFVFLFPNKILRAYAVSF